MLHKVLRIIIKSITLEQGSLISVLVVIIKSFLKLVTFFNYTIKSNLYKNKLVTDFHKFI